MDSQELARQPIFGLDSRAAPREGGEVVIQLPSRQGAWVAELLPRQDFMRLNLVERPDEQTFQASRIKRSHSVNVNGFSEVIPSQSGINPMSTVVSWEGRGWREFDSPVVVEQDRFPFGFKRALEDTDPDFYEYGY
jgi:hypothetical protein